MHFNFLKDHHKEKSENHSAIEDIKTVPLTKKPSALRILGDLVQYMLHSESFMRSFLKSTN